MKFRPKQCPTCEERLRNENYDLANDMNYDGPFICRSDFQDRLVFKRLIAKRKCHFFEREEGKP